MYLGIFVCVCVRKMSFFIINFYFIWKNEKNFKFSTDSFSNRTERPKTVTPTEISFFSSFIWTSSSSCSSLSNWKFFFTDLMMMMVLLDAASGKIGKIPCRVKNFLTSKFGCCAQWLLPSITSSSSLSLSVNFCHYFPSFSHFT